MGSEERLEQALRSFQEQAEKASELKGRLPASRWHARNADGSVTVTVAPSDAVPGLQLSPPAMRRSHTRLQRDVLVTLRDSPLRGLVRQSRQRQGSSDRGVGL